MLDMSLLGRFRKPVLRNVRRLADASRVMSSVVTASDGNGFYVLNGLSALGSPVRTVDYFNALNDTWSVKVQTPMAEYRSQACIHNNHLYSLSNGIYRLDTLLIIQSWTKLVDAGMVIRSARMVGYGNRLFIFGGELVTQNSLITNRMWVFNTNNNKISVLESTGVKPSARAYYGACAIGKWLYIHGGYSPTEGQMKDFWRYDMELNVWERLPDSPVPMHTHQIRVWNGKIYSGGAWSNGVNSGKIFEYDPVLRTWYPVSQVPYSGWWMAFEVANNAMYVLGGTPDASAGGATAQVWKIT